MENGIEVCFFLRTNAIAAYFSTRDGVQIHGLDDFIGSCMIGQVGFVAQDQEWNTFHGLLFQEEVELVLCVR